MFRRKPVVWQEHRYSGTCSDMASQMAKSLRRAPVEPPTMNVHHGLVGPRLFGSAPPPWNAANMVSFIDDADRLRYSLHDGVERRSGSRSLKLSLVGFDDCAHGDHRNLIFLSEWMEYGPGGRNVIFENCLHDVPSASPNLHEHRFVN
jgi:hypothetical protein